MIFIIIFIFLLLKELILYSNTFSFKNIHYVFSRTINIFFNYFNWKQNICFSSKKVRENINNENNILLISNHNSLTDFFHFISYVNIYHPQHRIVFVTKKDFSQIPILGNIIEKNCILLENDIMKDEYNIKKSIENIKRKNKKNIIIFFPEGKIFNNDNVERSNKWCNKINIEPFKKVVCPHYKGLYYIIKYFNPDKINSCFLYFNDDMNNNKGKEYYHYFTGYLPKYSQFYIKDGENIRKHYEKSIRINDEEYFKNKIYKYWRKIDNFILNKS